MSPAESLLQMLTLNAFAVLQPVLDLIANNPRYLKLEGISGLPIMLVMIATGLLIPGTAWLVTRLLDRTGFTRTARLSHSAVSGLYCGIIGLYILRWISRRLDLLVLGIPDFVLCGCSVLIMVAASRWLIKSEAAKQIIRIAALGLAAFPVSFLMQPSMQNVVLGIRTKSPATAIHCKKPVPVVMVVFDGMSGMSLLNPEHQIDKQRFPAFARLAEMGTWYRNATTVHTRTDHAVPAMLASCYPEEEQKPVESDYPVNLCRLIYDSDQYSMTVFEPVTEMAPDDLRQIDQQLSTVEQSQRLADAVSRVFARQILPRELESFEVKIPTTWFGFSGEQKGRRSQMRGKISYSWDTDRATQFDHFISSVESAERPGFYFFHIALPHYPWTLFPDGVSYSRVCSLSEPVYGLKFETWTDDEWPVRLAWQRNLLQIQMADRFFGKLLQRLEDESMLEECLLIVTADHGMAFMPGNDMRTPTDKTMGDIVSIPLFVKLPHQTEPAVNDRNVETVDIAPTIAEVLQFPAPDDWEGESLIGLDARSERPRKTVRGSVDTILSPDFPERYSHVQRLHAAFGHGHKLDSVGNLNQVPELINRHVDDFRIHRDGTQLCELRTHPFRRSNDPESFVPALVEGRFLEPSEKTGTVEIAIAVRNQIVATTRTSTDPFWSDRWSVLLPEHQTAGTESEFRLFEIRRIGKSIELEELKWSVEWDGRS